MFLKPYKVKSNTPLKGSDVKRLRLRLEKSYPNANLELLVPLKASVTLLKLVTHTELQTSLYCVDKLPMFFEIEDGSLVPSLYSMWQVPDLLPYFTTFTTVLQKLSNGADLMLPGVVPQGTGMGTYGHYKKGQLVAVNLTSNKSAVGVGYLPRSSDDLYMCGNRGVAVKMLHLFGDKLWAHEPMMTQQIPLVKGTSLTEDDFPPLGAQSARMSKKEVIESKEEKQEEKSEEELHNEEILSSLALKFPSGELLETPQIEESSKINENEFHNVAELVAENVEDTPEVVLKRAFLAALKNHGKSLQLPLLTSNFYRLYIVPEAEQPIELKKTKYKKLSNFLNEMIDQGFIVVREETKGIDKITSIDFDHPELVNFITDVKKPTENTATNESGSLFHSELSHNYIINDKTAPLFTKLDYKRGQGIPEAQMKKVIREYINKQNLPQATEDTDGSGTKSLVLDETLQRICGCKTASLSRIVNAVTAEMDTSYQMCQVKDVSANKPPIRLSLATRSGNKKVTLVSNIECYGIILSELIKLCKQGAAASVTTVKMPNEKYEQLQIQGNQVRFVHTLLTETYKVPSKCIRGLELAKSEKKHKKK